MALINPHINFNGNAEEAFNFYKSVFGGEFAEIMRFKDLASAEFAVADHEANKNFPKLSTGLREISWSHNMAIFSTCKCNPPRKQGI